MKRTSIGAFLTLFIVAVGLLPAAAAVAAVATSSGPTESSKQGQQAPPSTTLRSFKLTYLRPAPLVQMLAELYGGAVKTSVANDTLIVRTTPELMSSVAHLIEQRDTAEHISPDVDVVVYLLYASPNGVVNASIPKAIQPALVQLRKTFSFQGYRLLDTLSLRTSTARRKPAITEGRFLLPAEGKLQARSMKYRFAVQDIEVKSKGAGRSIAIGTIELESSFAKAGGVPGGGLNVDTGMSLREGQIAVLGKTSDGTPNAIIAVVMPKVVE